MCCLFGMVDYGHSFNNRQKTRLLSILAAETWTGQMVPVGFCHHD